MAERVVLKNNKGGLRDEKEETNLFKFLIDMADPDLADTYDRYMRGVKRLRKNITKEANE